MLGAGDYIVVFVLGASNVPDFITRKYEQSYCSHKVMVPLRLISGKACSFGDVRLLILDPR